MSLSGCVFWLTGISGSGKTTLANKLCKYINEANAYRLSIVIDADRVRSGVNNDLGFSDKDRLENIRRIAEIAKIFADDGFMVFVTCISPFEEGRKIARKIIENDFFYEIYIKADIETCIARDPKGLYAKALRKEITQFTGLDSPYEEPRTPDLVIETACMSEMESFNMLKHFCEEKFKKGVIVG